MTEQQQGGTAPETEAIAAAHPGARGAVAVAVADEPAARTETTAERSPTPSRTPPPRPPSRDRADAAEAAGRERRRRGRRRRPSRPSPPSRARARRSGRRRGVAATETAAETHRPAADEADAPGRAEEAPAPARDLGPEPSTMEELLAEQDSDIKSFKHGDVVEGTVVRIDKDEILVDIGAKSEGVVSNRELYGRNAESPARARHRRHRPGLRPPAGVAGGPRRPLAPPGRPRAQVALDAGAVRGGRDHRGPGHRPQQGRPHRRLRHPRLRADQPDRRLPAPTPERPAARRRPGDRREAPAVRRPQAPAEDPRGQPQGEPAHPVREGRPLRGAPREARRAVQQPPGRPEGHRDRPLDRPVRRLRRPRRDRRPRPQVRS